MSKTNTPKLKWWNFYDSKHGVYGIAYISKNFKAELHKHPVKETYFILHGKAKMSINDKIITVSKLDKIIIPVNSTHALTPISDFVLLLYWFDRGPFQNIKYTYLNSFL